MKKLLLLLLCFPMIGFGQDDCGKKPFKPFNKSGKDYKEYKIKYDLWLACKENADSNALYKSQLPINNSTNLIEFEEIVAVEGMSKNDLYYKAKEWFARTFNSANDVVQMENIESGKIIGKGISDIIVNFLGSKTKEMLHYTLILSVKDGRYRLKLTNFYFQVYPDPTIDNLSKMPAEGLVIDLLYNKRGKPYKVNKTRKEQLILKANSIISDLKHNILSEKNDDDW